MHMASLPQGLGSQGLGTTQPWAGVGSGTRPSGHLQVGSPSWGMHMEPGPQGFGSQGFRRGAGVGGAYEGRGGGGAWPGQVLAQPAEVRSGNTDGVCNINYLNVTVEAAEAPVGTVQVGHAH